METHICNLRYCGGWSGRLQGQSSCAQYGEFKVSLGTLESPCLKINIKKGQGSRSDIECLTNLFKALSSISSIIEDNNYCYCSCCLNHRHLHSWDSRCITFTKVLIIVMFAINAIKQAICLLKFGNNVFFVININ